MTILAGLMSGTSMDAVDGCLADFSSNPPRILATACLPLDDLAPALRQLATGNLTPHTDPIDLLGAMDHSLGERFADCAIQLLEESGLKKEQITAVGLHGQTIRHRPEAPKPFTLQIGDPNRVAERTGIPTVADFRRRDMAARGQGAPLAPIAHRQVLGTAQGAKDLVVVNLGGIANASFLSAEGRVQGFDTGPANTLLDAWVREKLGQPFDRDGLWALSGTVDRPLLDSLVADPWFQRPPPKSTGPEYFNLDWVSARAQAIGVDILAMAPEDVQATLLQLTATTVADALASNHAAMNLEVILVGGGALNPALVQAIGRAVKTRAPGTPVESSAERGIDPQWVECLVFAWLAGERVAGRKLQTMSVTGARHPVQLGGLYLP
ncbi:MAG: anhydro-N-acetylmuramic acid kinase [Halothiobacillaceae bacterium]